MQPARRAHFAVCLPQPSRVVAAALELTNPEGAAFMTDFKNETTPLANSELQACTCALFKHQTGGEKNLNEEKQTQQITNKLNYISL